METKTKIGVGAAFATGLVAGALFLVPANATRCALLSEGAFTGKFYFTEGSSCPPDPRGKPYSFLPAPKVTPPSHDPATQVLEGPTYTVNQDEVTESWNVRNKTAQELDEDKGAVLEGINKAVFKSLCHLKNELRTKVEGVDAWSEAQCLAAFKSLL